MIKYRVVWGAFGGNEAQLARVALVHNGIIKYMKLYAVIARHLHLWWMYVDIFKFMALLMSLVSFLPPLSLSFSPRVALHVPTHGH
jgi:cytochrome b